MNEMLEYRSQELGIISYQIENRQSFIRHRVAFDGKRDCQKHTDNLRYTLVQVDEALSETFVFLVS